MALWFKTIDELMALHRAYNEQVAALGKLLGTAKQVAAAHKRMNSTVGDTSDVLDPILTSAKELMANTVTYSRGELSLYMTSGYGLEVAIGSPSYITNAHLQASTPDATHGTLTLTSTLDVFDQLAVGDKIELVDCAHAENDGVYDITGKTSNKILVLSPDFAINDAADLSVKIIWRYDAA